MRHLRLYRAIRLIAKTGSIRKASEYMAISPSALNRSIQGFEADLGVEIFERVANGVRLSAAGELLFRPIIGHLDEMDSFSALLAEMRGGRAGQLRLSVSADLMTGPLGPALALYRARYPGVALELRHDEGHGPLAAREVDLALVSLPVTEDGVEVALSQALGLVGRVHAGHPGAGGALDPSDIMGHTLIVPPLGSGVRAAVDVALRRAGVGPAALLVCPGPYPGLGLGARPDLQIALACDPAPQGTATVPLSGLRLGPVQVTLLRRAGGSLPRTAAQFAAILDGVLAGSA